MDNKAPNATGGRSCTSCLFHHPERKKPCSVFGRCVTHDNCCAYIGDGSTEKGRETKS